jgi:hypothetical protein
MVSSMSSRDAALLDVCRYVVLCEMRSLCLLCCTGSELCGTQAANVEGGFRVV